MKLTQKQEISKTKILLASYKLQYLEAKADYKNIQQRVNSLETRQEYLEQRNSKYEAYHRMIEMGKHVIDLASDLACLRTGTDFLCGPEYNKVLHLKFNEMVELAFCLEV